MCKLRDFAKSELTEWLIRYGTNWVNWQDRHDFMIVSHGYCEREGLIERDVDNSLGDYSLLCRITPKGLEFLNGDA